MGKEIKTRTVHRDGKQWTRQRRQHSISIRRCRIKLFIKDVVELAAEIGVSCSGSPWPDPLGFNAHLIHVSSDRSLSDTDAGFTKLPCDLGGTVVLVGPVINLPDEFFDRFLTLTGDRYRSAKESMVAGT